MSTPNTHPENDACGRYTTRSMKTIMSLLLFISMWKNGACGRHKSMHVNIVADVHLEKGICGFYKKDETVNSIMFHFELLLKSVSLIASEPKSGHPLSKGKC